MEDGILSLKWNNHNSTFIQTLSTLHNAETYSDVTIACEGKYFPVHKLVLSICSEYFEEILSRTKCQHPVIVLKDIKHGDLEALLNYMYAGEANVAQNELASLIKAAECLRIKGLAVPDEAPPVRDKRRQTEASESANFSKRRRNEDINLPISSQQQTQTYRESDVKGESSRLSDASKNKRRLEDGPERLEDIHSDRNLTVTTLEEDNYHNIPEIVLDGQPVEVKQEMTEPKIEEHMEEDPHQNLGSDDLSLAYGVDIVDENSESERQGQESHILQDLMSHSGPGTSGIHGHDAMANWENNSNNLSGYSVDSYSSDEGRNQQLGDGGSSSATSSSAFVSDGESGFLGSDLVVRALGSKDSSPTGFPGTFHQCHCCPKKFLTRQDLRRHFRTHTGERPFKCPYCSYRAALKGNVKKHVMSVHKIILSADGKVSSDGSSGGGGTTTQGVTVDLVDSTDTRWDT